MSHHGTLAASAPLKMAVAYPCAVTPHLSSQESVLPCRYAMPVPSAPCVMQKPMAVTEEVWQLPWQCVWVDWHSHRTLKVSVYV